jgi:signal transduction histidine kinase
VLTFILGRSGKSGGLRLITMRERVCPFDGTLELESEPGCGTTVRAEVPTPNALQAGASQPSL